MRGRNERSLVEELQDEVTILRLFSRRLWISLRRRQGAAIDTLLDDLTEEVRKAVDPVFDAVQTIWAKHKVLVEPCRMVLDAYRRGLPCDWPTQDERYVGRWPDGSTRDLTRDQVLMMGGIDPASAPPPDPEAPFA